MGAQDTNMSLTVATTEIHSYIAITLSNLYIKFTLAQRLITLDTFLSWKTFTVLNLHTLQVHFDRSFNLDQIKGNPAPSSNFWGR